jgi:hypothetical protein
MTGTMPTQIATEAQILRNNINGLVTQLDVIGDRLTAAGNVSYRTPQEGINVFKGIYSESISVRQNLLDQLGNLPEVKSNKEIQGELFVGAKLFKSFDQAISAWTVDNSLETVAKVTILGAVIEEWLISADRYFTPLNIDIKGKS